MRPVLLIHGGAGAMKRMKTGHEILYRRSLDACVRAGWGPLSDGAEPLDAVEAAVRAMEVSGVFNAGVGSVLDEEGNRTFDAAIMRGSDLAAGACGSATAPLHPITLARRIMEDGHHVLMVCGGADSVARAHDLAPARPISDHVRKTWRQTLAKRRHRPGTSRASVESFGDQRILEDLEQDDPERDAPTGRSAERPSEFPSEDGVTGTGLEACDTVGAVAVTADGRLAAAVSTGGLWLKKPGRVGDSAVVGAGLYACDRRGAAAVATGDGDAILRVALSRLACDLVINGCSAQRAAEQAIAEIGARLGEETAGLIVLDREGGVGAAMNTAGMGRAVIIDGAPPAVAVWPDETFPT